jgi:hypothetical protein
MPAEKLYGVDREARQRNNESIRAALEQLWAQALSAGQEFGVLAAVPIDLETRDSGRTRAVIFLAASKVASESDSDDVAFEILARISIASPDFAPPEDVPNDPRVLRPGEWAARQLHFTPYSGYYRYNKVTEYGTSAESHQQEGLVKALMQHATEAAARFLVQKYRGRIASSDTQIIVADRSAGKGELQLEQFAVKVAKTLPGFEPTKAQTFEKWIEV